MLTSYKCESDNRHTYHPTTLVNKFGNSLNWYMNQRATRIDSLSITPSSPPRICSLQGSKVAQPTRKSPLTQLVNEHVPCNGVSRIFSLGVR